MTTDITASRWRDQPLEPLLLAYHLRTEAEKGVAVSAAEELPPRYRAEVLDPRAAFAADAVWVAETGGSAVGCVVASASADGSLEVKRLWVDPACRGRGAARALVGAVLDHAVDVGADSVRLSVWHWRRDAIGLYERLGFTRADPWDDRPDLVCMRRPAVVDSD
ncbi:putative acetyltransferase [Saccharothrix saharensis]|uniref:Putative acetyltransferase n=1 Tax=Saccharothrix saharensis TaxID=571190 RepID=A0A543J873_9PSEU|nr:GNAT family N-acetyltransferase [Saccharothrix saharensis]TQM79012.1 putative acetyltransferase [Saccharothrix saharensis]